jgi:predicted O-methyltransferase YrrM
VIETFKPKLIIEVGTWKGASLVHMAQLAEQQGLDTQFICIDTWLGSNDSLWLRDKYRKSLMLENGYPTMYRQFIHNIQKKGIADRVFPLPMTSSAAYHLLKQLEIRPDAVYIDAGHEEEEVKIDLEYYYDLLKPNGVLFGDDYSFYWSGVVAAVNKFAAKHDLPLWANPEKLTGKFMIQKPS